MIKITVLHRRWLQSLSFKRSSCPQQGRHLSHPFSASIVQGRPPILHHVHRVYEMCSSPSAYIHTGPYSPSLYLTSFLWWISAPRSSSTSTDALCPLAAAQWRAVHPPYIKSIGERHVCALATWKRGCNANGDVDHNRWKYDNHKKVEWTKI